MSLEHVSFRYPETDLPVLIDINLSIDQGEVIGVAGPTGAGKTTLCLAMMGLIPHVTGGELSGRAVLDGRDTSSAPLGDLLSPNDAGGAMVAMTFQDPESQIIGMTVEEELAFGLENLGVPRPEMLPRIDEVLEEAVRALSADDLQRSTRVSLAQVLALNANINHAGPLLGFLKAFSPVFDEHEAFGFIACFTQFLRRIGEVDNSGRTWNSTALSAHFGCWARSTAIA